MTTPDDAANTFVMLSAYFITRETTWPRKALITTTSQVRPLKPAKKPCSEAVLSPIVPEALPAVPPTAKAKNEQAIKASKQASANERLIQRDVHSMQRGGKGGCTLNRLKIWFVARTQQAEDDSPGVEQHVLEVSGVLQLLEQKLRVDTGERRAQPDEQ